eukprot:TRINITY_DN112744_c0_g1_i1.p1 TRINITY_DN112744_c0_g1~~TRINITY_DN112744_c0_g1_i1.p1  ORF type:complete len:928 (-),score=114.69 TRINITY_DN112744_c0_g1_i1:138-2516(-)
MKNVGAELLQEKVNKLPPELRKRWFDDHSPTTPFLLGDIEVTIHRATGLPNMDTLSLTDAYVRVAVDDKKGVRTPTVDDNLNPVWNHTVHIPVSGYTHCLSFDVKDDDRVKPSLIGRVTIPVVEVLLAPLIEESYALDLGGHVIISAQYHHATGLSTEVDSKSGPFRQRHLCRVNLYQDALLDGFEPPLSTAFGPYVHKEAWLDVFNTLSAAQNFIYITGWAVWHKLVLLRKPPMGPCEPLGDLLKRKAKGGVQVHLMVWDDASNMMGTNDEETRAFFKDSAVKCLLVQRKSSSGALSDKDGSTKATSAMVSGIVGKNVIFTHHQKSIICDAAPLVPREDKKSRIVCFVGGLDLANGRYDCPKHELFSTLKTVHDEDYYQGVTGLTQKYGPRQPWHDIHAKLEGPIARDVMKNFEQRWEKQNVRHEWKGLLQPLGPEGNDKLMSIADDVVPDDQQQWNAQLFRSIDCNSAILEHPDPIEYSIQEAYIHHIRRAKRFIYFENQYFLGSSKEWIGFHERQFNIDCKHRVPAEITSRIIQAIREGQRFTVYVVIPMYPEGVPGSGAVQAILYWQFKTIEMMYHRIAKAIRDFNVDAKPTDYLNFYCLGNRELDYQPPGKPSDELSQTLTTSKRFMIYVHSKMFIVDDEYILIGSANINERSMCGDRDTEIAVGMHQPQAPMGSNGLQNGDVAAFRKSLFVEHAGSDFPELEHPDSLECMRKVNAIAQENWDAYASDNQPLKSHLLQYPYKVADVGSWNEANVPPILVPAVEKIVDFKDALVKGAQSDFLPTVLTT